MAELLTNDYQEFTLDQLKTQDGISTLNSILRTLVQNMVGDGETVRIFKGYGTPESSVTAGIGSLYMRIDGGSATTLYIKESGTGNIGWTVAGGVAGTGDVVGPASATDNAIVRFDSTTGKLIQNSNATVSDLGRLDISITDTVGADTTGIYINANKNVAGGANTLIGLDVESRQINVSGTQTSIVGILSKAIVDASATVTNSFAIWGRSLSTGNVTNRYAAGFGGEVLFEPTNTSPGSPTASSTSVVSASHILKLTGDFQINGPSGGSVPQLLFGDSTKSSASIFVSTSSGSFTPIVFFVNDIQLNATKIRLTVAAIGDNTFTGSATIPANGQIIQGYSVEEAGGRVLNQDFAKTTSTTLGQVGSGNSLDLAVSLVAGKWYTFQAKLFVDADVVGGHKYSIGGTATATSMIYNVNSISNTTNAYVINTRQTAMGASFGQAGATSIYTEINGTIQVNAAGTFNVEFAQNASSGTSTVLKGSSLFVKQMY